MKAYKMLKMSQTSPITPNLIQGVIRRTFLWNINWYKQSNEDAKIETDLSGAVDEAGTDRDGEDAAEQTPHTNDQDSFWWWDGLLRQLLHQANQRLPIFNFISYYILYFILILPANIYLYIIQYFIFYIYIPPGQSMHYRLSSIKGVRFRFANFASHFKGKCHFHFLIHWVLLKSL